MFKYQDDKYQLKYAYGNAVAGLEKTETFLTEGTTDNGTMVCNVHFEFVAKSVNDQMGMYLSALLSVVGFIPGTTGVVAGAISGLIMWWARYWPSIPVMGIIRWIMKLKRSYRMRGQ